MPDAQQPLWRRYLRFWRPNVAADVDDEFAFHIEECIDELVAGGMDPLIARQTATRRLQELEQVKATCRVLAMEQERSMRRTEWFGALHQDVTLQFRAIPKYCSGSGCACAVSPELPTTLAEDLLELAESEW